MPAVAKILIVFASMLMASRLKLHLGLALLIGGLALNIWAGLSFVESITNLGAACLRAEFWMMLLITALVVDFGHFVSRKDNADNLLNVISSIGGKHGRAWSMMAVPAVIGLVPIPAGALISAPFVKKAADAGKIPNDEMAAINYWFRHIWEYWWPVYPGVIVAMSLFVDIENWRFVLVQAPFTLVVVLTGFLFMVRPHAAKLKEDRTEFTGNIKRAVYVLVPVILILVSVLVLPFLFNKIAPDMLPQNVKMLSVVIGLLLGVVVTTVDAKRRGDQVSLVKNLVNRKALSIIAIVGGVMVFKYMMQCSGLVALASEEMGSAGAGLLLSVVFLPFLAGIITGIAVGFTGTAFPFVVAIMDTPGSGLTPCATLVLAYGFGYMGMMLSPVHLCMLVSKDYFSSSLFRIYRRILPAVLTVLVYSVALHCLLRFLGW